MNALSPYNRALGWLARREHSAKEVLDKLIQMDEIGEEEAQTVLLRLQQNSLQSDMRFAESYANGQINKGYGAMKIRYVLGQRGVADEVINAALSALNTNWTAVAQLAWQKKYGHAPKDFKEQTKQQAFLSRRGFSFDEIRAVMNNI